jgi:hypothetical protein
VIADPAGDAGEPGVHNDAQLDITAGYLQVTPNTVTTVVRVGDLSAEDVTNPQGRIYEFDFSVGSQNFLTMASLLPGGSEFQAFVSQQRLEQGKSGARAATGIGTMRGSLNLRTHDVRLSGPLSMFEKYAKFSQNNETYIDAFTYKANGESLSQTPVGRVVDISLSLGIGVDEAWSQATYNRYGRSCAQAVRGHLE